MGRSRKAGGVMAPAWFYALKRLAEKQHPFAWFLLPDGRNRSGYTCHASLKTTKALRSAGLLEMDGNGLCTITPAGRAALTEGEKS